MTLGSLRPLQLALLAPLLLQAQSSAVKARKFIDETVEALGGDRFLHMQNRVESGRAYSFYNLELSGLDIATVYTEYLDQPPPKGLSVRERQQFGKKQDYSILFFEDQGWEITFRGARPVSEQSLSRFLNSTRNNIFYVLRERLAEPGLEFDYVRDDLFQNKEVVLIDVIDKDNHALHVIFDRITKLPLRQSFDYVDPLTKYRVTETTDYAKYREVMGITWPYSIQRARDGEKVFEIYSEKVQFNQDLPAGKFSLPPGVKVLPPAK